jgi:hypothetical protein
MRRALRSLGLLVTAIPKFGCPMCWPAIAAIAGACGVQLQTVDRALTVLSIACVAATLVILTRQRSCHAAAIFSAALVILLFRLGLLPAWSAYVASAVLVAATVRRRILSSPVASGRSYEHCCPASTIPVSTT